MLTSAEKMPSINYRYPMYKKHRTAAVWFNDCGRSVLYVCSLTLEGQIFFSVSKVNCGRRRNRTRNLSRVGRLGGLVGGSLSRSCNGSSFVEDVGTQTSYASIPATVIFAAFDVESQTNELADLEWELIGTITEEVEEDFLGEAFLGFEYILALLPVVAGL